MAQEVTTPQQTVWQFENKELWNEERYASVETDRARLTLSWLPADVHSVLDVGCGNGVLTNLLTGPDLVVGTDRSLAALGFVRKPRAQSDIVRLPFGDCAFDAVVATEVIEHIPDGFYAPALAELARVARRYLLITVPYNEALWLARARCPHCGTRFHEHGHMRSYGADDLRTHFEGIPGIRLVRQQPVFPFRRYRLLKEGLTIYKQAVRSRQSFPRFAVCPNCGYTRAAPTSPQPAAVSPAGGSPSSFKRAIKRQWPLVESYRWWLALFEKGDA